ncbi:uncharacterized protein LOC116126772 isoform X1 [Pistacia vera]|uniref:uncharacterized protein LOC116126772 isoform X1 n=2 Tax=Pistacia vera TaxID=55513 RepID=UPI0012637BBD|nr:uncharacterized protein LOC116126772 isoform X1 [Pistacia vera]
MKTLIFVNSINDYSNPLLNSSPNFPFRFPSLSREYKIFQTKWLHYPKTLYFSPIRASSLPELPSYGGWDDLGLVGDSVSSGESTPLRNFLVSIGVNDKKHIFLFLSGLVCALAISRVRVSTIIVFPASVLVFAIGFSVGFVRGGSLSEVSGSKRRSKEENFRVYSEKFKSLLDIFDGLNGNINNLKKDIQRAIDCNKITISDLENYFNAVESMNLSASNARNATEAYIINPGNSNDVLVENQKSSKKKKEIGKVGFDWLQFIEGIFGEKAVNSKPNKVKDKGKQGTPEGVMNDQNQGNNLSPGDEIRFHDSINNNKGISNSSFFRDSLNKYALDQDWDRRKKVDVQDEKVSSGEVNTNANRVFESEDFSYQNNRLLFNNHRVSLNMGSTNETKAWESGDNLLDSVDFRVSWKHMESEASFVQERILRKSSGAYRSSDDTEKYENVIYRPRLIEEGVNPRDDSHLADHLSAHRSVVNSSSSSVFTDDVAFNRYLTEANGLLKQAKECIRSSLDDEHVEMILCKSAKLLSKAIVLKPMSLLAVGQLGNTYLLHGELKLWISRELRSLLSRSNVVSVEKQKRVLKGLDYQLAGKDRIASLLVDACEECEELLVKAGKKYRLALSIDGNDVKALYNWGLALSFRAQLVADIGPEAAFDADKIFLAAIEKFDAMMSKGNVYASDALFRWAVVLQQRSRLRPRNSKEKVKLLQQAKRLYEDALHMDCDNLQARDALLSCMSELNYSDF